MGRQEVSTVRAAEDAIAVLGQQIRLARLARGMTAEHLAGSAGISRKTLTGIENGSAAASIGKVFTVATIVGVPLFGVDDPGELLALRRRGEERLALLPSRVSVPRESDDDGLDF
ncbi:MULTISPECIES: helix-turn-helix transcriptional regulator [Microbacterium]|uniref:helix-turn-helix transcriptional regulator n=1 Tax=Microbacterium TaxID=33882 RepID=UPI0027822535|nr:MULTISPECIES: helix-turn-helix transcriptional regulator [Microbacterium]MDQ1075133.1 transcriptional regulator with XRE-family HTH domain [Microbacterium sp. SORGH_AS_0969]MDQ1115364.1 transcriptional regulator with XRE-family HTH domain [Microbacterium testaceum]